VDVGVLAEHITRIIAPELLHRTRLQLDLEPVPEIVADRARLEQALLGMVFNAAQSIASGAPEDNTVTLRVAVADGAVEMCVVDTGADMAAERVHVFDPFFPSRGLSEGLGLGLTYAHAEVTALGGTLSVSTADGGGTRIRITLPVAGDTAAAPLPRGLRLLIIDDEVSILKVVQRMLQGRFEIVGVASGAEGLERLRSEAYDLVLCDLMMPSMTGMQLYDILCREQPEVARSMVFMTGGALSESARAFLGAHESVCITKPFTLEDLLTILGRAVEAPAAR
jgi:CheY-like chemotaxis protein/anti-sigma regulatory factor (Ser/Thr protein kinase)